jgi:hypothetical protein
VTNEVMPTLKQVSSGFTSSTHTLFQGTTNKNVLLQKDGSSFTAVNLCGLK